ncbi:hypothetical protein PLESTB_000671400 [Pleodorina starrii]|uniref:Uncharacterized protein n=1 Tax=Pleodorina starrii TaxID=330485 RepID=A0A9W6F146_9CHLO|nr:hypothetical protein PLESTB_000671400 [Pleodorina starrii]
MFGVSQAAGDTSTQTGLLDGGGSNSGSSSSSSDVLPPAIGTRDESRTDLDSGDSHVFGSMAERGSSSSSDRSSTDTANMHGDESTRDSIRGDVSGTEDATADRDARNDDGSASHDARGSGGDDGGGRGDSDGDGARNDVSAYDSNGSATTAVNRRKNSSSDEDEDGDEGSGAGDGGVDGDGSGNDEGSGSGDAGGSDSTAATAANGTTTTTPGGRNVPGDQAVEPEDWGPEDSDCPRTNLTRLSKHCRVLRQICMHQETLVTHDWRYSYANPRREPLPDMPWVENWNFPATVGTNTDALKGRGPRYRLRLRPGSAFEPTAALREPVFSNCTLPLMIVADFPFNMGEFFAKVVSALDRLEMDDRVTLVLQTPMVLGLAAFHSLLLMPYSRYPAITAGELGSTGCNDCIGGGGGGGGGRSDPRVGGTQVGAGSRRAVPWSSEPVQPHCFRRMIMCKWDLQTGGGTPLAMVANRLVTAWVGAGLLPPSPVRFPGGSGRGGSDADPDPRGKSTLRVLIESRQGPVRNIKNMEELLAACKQLNRDGFSAGPFRHIACASTSFADSDGSVSRERFLANVAAVRSAHVLVVLHGAGATNSWFMRQGSSALVELRPCSFGTRFGGWPDKYMPKQHEKNDDVIRFFALNIEDLGQCLQGDIETSLRNHTARRDNVGWDASYFARDQHLQLKPGPFLEFVRHVGELLLDVQAYREARDADRLHGYVVPEGLMYGKLGITKLEEFRAASNPPVIPFL